jgi:trigger factor
MEVHQFIADFQANLLGMSSGEEKTFDVKFPENYQSKELAGKTAQFEVCVRKVLNEVTSRIAEKALELQKKFEIEKAEAAAKVNQQAVMDQEGV